MTKDKSTRDELVFLLTRGNAHMPFEEVVDDFPAAKMNAKFTHGKYTFWGLLEHIRRTQKDILNFIVDENYKEPEWPEDYWPGKNKKADRSAWNKTIKEFLQDRKALVKLIEDPKTDLYKKIPWGSGQTFIREILVIADHNAFELGEFSIMRQTLSAWGKNHKE
jgi:hypothetical protein